MPPAKRNAMILLGACLAAAWAGFGPAAEVAAPPVSILANRDDDDRDGVADAADDRVNGDRDRDDLTPLPVAWPPGTTVVKVSAPGAPLRFFLRQSDAWTCLGVGGGESAVPEATSDEAPAVYVEATAWAGMPPTWSGTAAVQVCFERSEGPPARAELSVRVAPVRLLPSTAPAERIYVSTGRYDNASFVERLRGILDSIDVPLVTHPATDWREMWMQDTMEIAVTTTDRGGMHVVLAGLRNADTFPPTLLGPDVAVAVVATSRSMGGGDAWADWYGNLEASVPTSAHPLGRVIHGRNRLTGIAFHPDAVRFLAAQGAQPPVWIDTSWLLIKHVDEIVSFLPGPDGGGAILVPDPELGLRLLGDDPNLAPPVAERRREANRRIAREIEAMLHGGGPGGDAPSRAGDAHGAAGGGLLGLVGLDAGRVVRLPVAFDVPAEGLLPDGGVTNASSIWSNPVNALVVNGTVICGSAAMPAAVRDACRERFLAAGVDRVEFIDDGVYQKNHGNVHCATNARRE